MDEIKELNKEFQEKIDGIMETLQRAMAEGGSPLAIFAKLDTLFGNDIALTNRIEVLEGQYNIEKDKKESSLSSVLDDFIEKIKRLHIRLDNIEREIFKSKNIKESIDISDVISEKVNMNKEKRRGRPRKETIIKNGNSDFSIPFSDKE